MELFYLGTLTLHIEAKDGRLNLPADQMKDVANQFLTKMLSRASDEFEIEFDYTLINVYPGCVKTKVKFFVKTVSLAAVASFFLKYPDVRNNMWEFFKDAEAIYQCTVNGANKDCYVQVLSGELVAYTHEIKKGDSLSKIVESWEIPGYTTYQVMIGTYRQNPKAFIDGNINKLKIGTVLGSPTKENLKGIPQKEAG